MIEPQYRGPLFFRNAPRFSRAIRRDTRMYAISLGSLATGLLVGYAGLGLDSMAGFLVVLGIMSVALFDTPHVLTLYNLFKMPTTPRARLWYAFAMLALFMPWGYSIYITRAIWDLYKRAKQDRQIQYTQLHANIKRAEHDLFGG